MGQQTSHGGRRLSRFTPSTSQSLFTVTLDDADRRSIDQLPVKTGGVYVFCSDDGTPTYVGQSQQPRTRCRKHLRDGRSFAEGATEVLFFDLDDHEARLVLETVLILQHRPRFNQTIKIGISNSGALRELQFLRS